MGNYPFGEQNFAFGEQNFPFADDSGTCTVTIELIDFTGGARAGVEFVLCLETAPVVTIDGKLIDPTPLKGSTGSDGKVLFNLAQGYRFRIFSNIFQNKSFVFDTTGKSSLSAADIFV